MTTRAATAMMACMGSGGEGMAEAQHWYRVVYFDGARIRGLGRVPDVAPNRHALDLFRSRLLLAGITGGELALVDEATGQVVARRRVRDHRRRG
jgi:hypothetical protein